MALGPGPRRPPQSVHLWHEQGQAEPAKTWTGAAAGPGAAGRPGTASASARGAAAGATPGFSPSARLAGRLFPSLWDGLAGKKKKLISRLTQRGQRIPHAEVRTGELVAPFRAAGVDVSEPGFSLNRLSTSRRQGLAPALPSVALQVSKGQLSA